MKKSCTSRGVLRKTSTYVRVAFRNSQFEESRAIPAIRPTTVVSARPAKITLSELASPTRKAFQKGSVRTIPGPWVMAKPAVRFRKENDRSRPRASSACWRFEINQAATASRARTKTIWPATRSTRMSRQNGSMLRQEGLAMGRMEGRAPPGAPQGIERAFPGDVRARRAEVAFVDFAVVAHGRDHVDDEVGLDAEQGAEFTPVPGQAAHFRILRVAAGDLGHVGLGDSLLLGDDQGIDDPSHQIAPLLIAVRPHRTERFLRHRLGQDDVIVRGGPGRAQAGQLRLVGGQAAA